MKFTFNIYHVLIVAALFWEITFKFVYDKNVNVTEIWLMIITFALVDILRTLNKK